MMSVYKLPIVIHAIRLAERERPTDWAMATVPFHIDVAARLQAGRATA